MIRPTLISLGLLVLLLLAGCRQEGVANIAWLSDWAEATAQSKASGRPVMIVFVRPDVSAWSTRLQSEVFTTESFSSWVSGKVVPLKVDLSNGQSGISAESEAAKVELARKYGVVGFPTVVMVDADGKALGSLRYISGGPGPWIARADEVLAGKEPAELPWLQTWEQAVAASKASGKPVMMDFTGSDWCVFCIKLKHEVFATQAFRDWAAARVILLEVDFPRSFDLDPALISQNEGLAAKYGIQGFPTIIFAKASGEVLGSLGYSEGGPSVWLKSAELAMAAGKAQPKR